MAEPRVGPFDGWSLEYVHGPDGDEVVLTMIGVGEADDLVIPFDVDTAEDMGASFVEMATGRRPEWCERGPEYDD